MPAAVQHNLRLGDGMQWLMKGSEALATVALVLSSMCACGGATEPMLATVRKGNYTQEQNGIGTHKYAALLHALNRERAVTPSTNPIKRIAKETITVPVLMTTRSPALNFTTIATETGAFLSAPPSTLLHAFSGGTQCKVLAVSDTTTREVCIKPISVGSTRILEH
jgi:hypothetical protein